MMHTVVGLPLIVSSSAIGADLDTGRPALLGASPVAQQCRKRISSGSPGFHGIQGRLHGKHVRSVRTCLSTGSLVQDADVVSEEDENVPKRVCIFVEPSPFTYVCGYKNRFCETIKHLVGAGCEVLVITTGKGVSLPGADTSAMRDAPEDYYGAKVVSSFSIGCPLYPQLPLSLALSPRIYKKIKSFKPDLIHSTTPGFMCFSAWIYSKLMKLPLVPLLWTVIRIVHTAAHLTLATSVMLANELKEQKAAPDNTIQVWKKGVDTEVFNPKFKSLEMRSRLTDGHPEDPIMVHVGRLGAEKNLKFLKDILERIPNLRLAFVGDGPSRQDLQEHFKGTNTTFLGMLHGEELSASYASADLFAMPSESETLGFVVLEAMASQVPVVAVRAGGIPDIIHSDDVGGFLYAPGDLDHATELVQNLVKNKELRESSGLQAREAVSEWDWNAATLYLMKEQYPMALKNFENEQKAKVAAKKDAEKDQPGTLSPVPA